MNSQDTKGMTDEQLEAAIAIHVMGWDIRNANDSFAGGRLWYLGPNQEADSPFRYFRPLTDWNHWREVEEKIMEDDLFWGTFMDRIDPEAKLYDQVPSSESLMKADLRTRCLAALSACSPPQR